MPQDSACSKYFCLGCATKHLSPELTRDKQGLNKIPNGQVVCLCR